MLGLAAPAFAQKETFKEHLENHVKLYGFIRNYFTYDNRESVAGTGDLYYWTPKDNNWNYASDELAKLAGAERQDLNAQNQFRFLALTSRLGVDVSGYKTAGIEFGAKIEADFYAGLTGSTGTAQFRLRQAFLTMNWKNLGKNENNSAMLKVGQAWHPMAADMPDIYSLETGAPFGPFSRTPLAQADFNIGQHFTLTGAAIWQMQYTSMGPNKASADYIKYGCVPEFYLGVSAKTGGLLGRVGVNITSIKPRNIDDKTKMKVNERMNSALLFAYVQYKKDLFTAKAKTTFGGAGEQFGIMSGYVDYLDDKGAYKYAPINSSSTWVSLSYGKKVVGTLFAGYMQNLGTAKEHSIASIYFNKNGFSNINRMFRIEPEITYNIGKFQVGLEYMMTATQFGSFAVINGTEQVIKAAKHGIAAGDLHWVANHRIQGIVKFSF